VNNLTFGNERYQYYETICSGAPAGEGFDGAPGVHTHMTNSRLTDPEILESRFPVVLEDFHIRQGSGGRGRWRAGDGTSRTIRFRERMECALLSGHRRVRPFGLNGGSRASAGATSCGGTTAASRSSAAAPHGAGARRGHHGHDADRRRLRQGRVGHDPGRSVASGGPIATHSIATSAPPNAAIRSAALRSSPPAGSGRLRRSRGRSRRPGSVA
jgi:hypothetical protein